MREAKSTSIQTVPQINVPEAFYGLVLYKELSKRKIWDFCCVIQRANYVFFLSQLCRSCNS